MEITRKTILYGIFVVLILLLILGSSRVINFNPNKTTDATENTAGGEYGNIPEKCRPPNGESVSEWKEHLGHHPDTQECLSYFS